MSEKIEIKVEKAVDDVIKKLGFSIEYVEFVKEANNNVLRIVIDKEGSLLNVDDCETVSRTVEDIVDKIIDKEYVLEVASPGLERQLKNIKLYKKYAGKEIFVKLYKKSKYGKEFTCILKTVNEKDNTIMVELDKEDVNLSLNDIANAYTTYDFNSLLDKKSKTNINELNKF